MPARFEAEPNYELVIEKLLEKTREGKIDWQPTADDDCFVAAVKGVQTYEIKRIMGRTTVYLGAGPPERDVLVSLVVKDGNGREVFDVHERGLDTPAYDLFEAARRVATRIDKHIDESLQLLNSL
jgi:hypothetical protein